jgi:hypothetical protein
MAGHSWSTPLQPLLQGPTKHHLKAPRCPGLLLPYKRAGQDPTRGHGRTGKTQVQNQVPASKGSQFRDQHLKQTPLYSFFLSLRLGLATLSHKLVTPTQAPRCKKIQNSPPAGRRAFFCPNQDKPPCVLLASPSRLGTRSTHSSV